MNTLVAVGARNAHRRLAATPVAGYEPRDFISD